MFRIFVAALLLGAASVGLFMNQETTIVWAETVGEADSAVGDYETIAELVPRIAVLEARLSAAEAELSVLRGQLVAAQEPNPFMLVQNPSPGRSIIPPGGLQVIPQTPAPGPGLRITPPSQGQDAPAPQATPGQVTGQPDGIQLAGFGSIMKIVQGTINGVGGPHLIIEGVNVHIRSGSGATDDNGILRGLGNLIVGYNKPERSLVGRGGSHNLIVGDVHSYSSFGGLVVGTINRITGPYASVSGGTGNTASGPRSSVSGGRSNHATGSVSSVSGGAYNTATGSGSSVSGGSGNVASGNASSVSGGGHSEASGYSSSISGGAYNTATGIESSVGGSTQLTATDNQSFEPE